MTIPTPTRNNESQAAGLSPSHSPDEALLAQMANAFFQMLPNESGHVLPTGAPGTSAALDTIQTTGSGPTLTPVSSVPGTVPSSLPESVPTQQGRIGQAVPGLTETYTPSLPKVDEIPASPPTSPYYFMGEASAYKSQAAPVLPTQARDDRVSALPFAMPQTDDLHAVLASISVGHGPGISTGGVPASPPDVHRPFYFIDTAQPDTNHTPAVPAGAHPPFDVHAVRRDFPILKERVNGYPLAWLDNAATTQ